MLLLVAGSAFAFYEGHFVTKMITEQLTAQKIYFPPASEIKSGGALDPAEFPPEIQAQAGNQVTNGDQAKIYANDFIAKHLEGVAGGKTYSQVSSEAIALQAKIAATPPSDPSYASMQTPLSTLNTQKAVLFQGEMLRSTLLNSVTPMAEDQISAALRAFRRLRRTSRTRIRSVSVTFLTGVAQMKNRR